MATLKTRAKSVIYGDNRPREKLIKMNETKKENRKRTRSKSNNTDTDQLNISTDVDLDEHRENISPNGKSPPTRFIFALNI